MATIEANPNLGAQMSRRHEGVRPHSWSVRDAINPIAVAGAEGRYFWDYDGNRYLDFASQLVNVSIGHQHPKVVAAIRQADKQCTIGPPMASESRSQLGRLREVTPGDLTLSFFTNGGAGRTRTRSSSRGCTGRHKIVARYRSYHGATHGAISLTGDPRRWPAEPGMAGSCGCSTRTCRCPAGHPDPCPVCTGAPHLEEILEYEGPHTVAAVILETVTGTDRVIPPPDGYLRAIRETCDRRGILLIDEVMAGFGRTGRWFACDNWDVVPDILTVAKGISSGYVPLGAMIARAPIADWVRGRYFPGSLTYAGHPLACASRRSRRSRRSARRASSRTRPGGHAHRGRLHELAGGVIRRSGRYGNSAASGARAGEEPRDAGDARAVQRGRRAAAPVSRMAKAALEQGLYLMTHWNVVMVVTPLTITREEADEGLAILDEALAIADEYYEELIEEGRDRRGRLVEGVPEDGVPAQDDDDLERSPSASRWASRKPVVVRKVRRLRGRGVATGLLERCAGSEARSP